jgi:hypothetical protein
VAEFPQAKHDFAGLHANETFRACFTERDSPVFLEIESIQTRLLYHRLDEAEQRYLQGKLAGIRAVAMLVEAVFKRTEGEHERPVGLTRQEQPLAELRFLPRALQGRTSAFPGARRAAQGGK